MREFIVVVTLVLLFGAILVNGNSPEAPEKGKYHYPYKGSEIICGDGETWKKGMVRTKLKLDGKTVPCTILDRNTGKTEFGVEPDIIVFIRETL